MIQSVKFDSLNMDIKKIANSAFTFVIKRLIEISGVIFSFFGILLFVALISYSPNDPNFIFPENTEIENFIGFRGSYIADLFFQSIGLISYLVPFTLIFTGILIFKKKEFFLFIENTFYIIPYCLFGSSFFRYFYSDNFQLYINGNGGFVGNYFNDLFLNKLGNTFEIFLYYFLLILIISFFLISINFNYKTFYFFLKNVYSYLFQPKDKNYTNKNEIISEYITQNEIKNIIQKDFPFIKA